MAEAITRSTRSSVALEELLLRHGAITAEQVALAKEEVRKWGGDLGRAFVDLGFISEEFLMKAYAHTLQVPFVDPSKQPLDAAQVQSIGVNLCERFGIIAVEADPKKRTARIATSEPTNANVLREVSALTSLRLDLACATADAIAKAIRMYFYGEAGHVREETLQGVVIEEPAPARPPAQDGALVAQLNQRLARLEQYVEGLRGELAAELTTNPQLAALAARLEFLEQVASNDVGQLRALTELLIERGVIDAATLSAKVKQRRG